MNLTREQFERQEAKKLNVRVEDLKLLSMEIVRCGCKYKDCPGWNWEAKEKEA